MSESREQAASKSGVSFFTVAAWYSFLAPIFTPVVAFLILLASSRLDLPLGTAFCVLVSSFVLGVVSCRKPHFWIALIGIVFSVVLGFIVFVYWNSLRYWHG